MAAVISASRLQVVIRNAGHMSPGDQPWVAKEMIETWVASALADAELLSPAEAALDGPGLEGDFVGPGAA